MRPALALFVLLAPLACGRTDLSSAHEDGLTSGGGPPGSGASGGSPGSGAGGGPPAVGGRSPGTGGRPLQSSGGSLTTGGAASGGLSSGGHPGAGAASAGGFTSGTSGGSDALGGAGGERACGCDIELEQTGEPRTCEMFGGTLGPDARVWLCGGSQTPPFSAFEAAGCEGLPTGLYRSCCPPEVDRTDICAE